jgi:hypothetical protein
LERQAKIVKELQLMEDRNQTDLISVQQLPAFSSITDTMQIPAHFSWSENQVILLRQQIEALRKLAALDLKSGVLHASSFNEL